MISFCSDNRLLENLRECNKLLDQVQKGAFEDSHFMHQAGRVGHTDHTGSIVFPMACIFDLKKKFLCNRKLMHSVKWAISIESLQKG